MKPNAYLAKQSKINKLSPDQKEQLTRWLIEENLTYDQARLRLFERFQLETSTAALCHYWKRVCEPRQLAAEMLSGNKLLLDVRLVRRARLRVYKIGPEAIVAIEEEQEGK